MKKPILITLAAAALLSVTVWAGQRLRLIDIDSATTPAATAAVNVALTPAANGTNTVEGQTATAAVQTQVVKAGATQASLTLSTVSIDYLMPDMSTGTVVAVTNVTINTVYGFATTTPQVVITNTIAAVAAVTNVAGYSTSIGFTAAQANGILTNANLFYKLLQSY